MTEPVEPATHTVPDPVVTGDVDDLVAEVLRRRDDDLGHRATEELLRDRIAELEAAQEVYDGLAEANQRLRADYERLAGHPVVRAALAASRPFRRNRA